MQAVDICAETGVLRDLVRSKPPNAFNLSAAMPIAVVYPGSPPHHAAHNNLRQQKLISVDSRGQGIHTGVSGSDDKRALSMLKGLIDVANRRGFPKTTIQYRSCGGVT
jgi:hypothetical protein